MSLLLLGLSLGLEVDAMVMDSSRMPIWELSVMVLVSLKKEEEGSWRRKVMDRTTRKVGTNSSSRFDHCPHNPILVLVLVPTTKTADSKLAE